MEVCKILGKDSCCMQKDMMVGIYLAPRKWNSHLMVECYIWGPNNNNNIITILRDSDGHHSI